MRYKVCFRCHASMGRRDASLVYTDISNESAWRSTEYQTSPWTTEPSLSGLRDFNLQMLSLDAMHIWNLGVCRDLCGTVIKVLTRTRGYFPGSKIDIRLKQFMKELRAWTKDNNKVLTFKRLKKSNVDWRADACPHLKCSAADAGVVLEFLVHKLQAKPAQAPYEGLLACAWSANMFIKMLMRAGLFLSPAERDSIHTTGTFFLQSYLKLAVLAHSRSDLLFKLRPKWHILCHLVDDIRKKESGRNPMHDSTWLDEDYIKYSLRVFRKTSRMTSSLNVLKRALITQKLRLRMCRLGV